MKKWLLLLALFLPAVAWALPANVTNFPGGISTAPDDVDVLTKYIYPDPSRAYVYWNDMLVYTSGDWTITTTEDGTESATEAISTTIAGGALVLTNDNTKSDSNSLQYQGESFLLDVGKKTWLKTRISVAGTTGNDAATYSDIQVGLMITDTSPFTFTDGLIFSKNAGDTNIDFISYENSAGTTETALGTLVTGTMIDLGMYYDGKDMKFYIDGNLVGVSADASICDDEYLTPTISIRNGTAGTVDGANQRTLNVDYLLIAQER